MIKIDKDNYFSKDHKGLSQSKIKNYFKCPNFFYRNNILHTVDRKETPSFDVGTAVDNILTENDSVDNYAVVEGDGRAKEVKELRAQYEAAGKKILNKQQYEDILSIADSVNRTTAFEWIRKNCKFQEIIQIENNDLGEHFDSLLGKPDAYAIDSDGICTLIDIKTSKTIDERQFWYATESFGYTFQLFFYALLLKLKYPEIKDFKYFILAGEKAEPFGVRLFSVPNEYIDAQADKYIYAIKSIKEGLFDKEDASFAHPTLLCDPKDRQELLTEGIF